MTMFPLIPWSYEHNSELVGEIMIKPYRVMIETYQSVFFNKFQLNSHLYMKKYMHFEFWCSLCVYVSIVVTFTITTNPKIPINIEIMAHFDNTDHKIHNISDKLLIPDIRWFTYRAWHTYI